MSGQFGKQEVLYLHSVYDEIRKFYDIDVDGSRYEEFGVKPLHFHRQTDEQIWAVKLLSDLVMDELEQETWDLEDVPRLNWEEYMPEENVISSYGDISIMEGSQYVLKIDDRHFTVGKASNAKLGLLEDLADGRSVAESVDRNYEGFQRLDYVGLAEFESFLEEGRLKERYRDDLSRVLEEVFEQEEIGVKV